jgi:hypothetical protein
MLVARSTTSVDVRPVLAEIERGLDKIAWLPAMARLSSISQQKIQVRLARPRDVAGRAAP